MTTFEAIRKATHLYIARLPCGCVSGARTDTGDVDTAEDVANFLRSGRTIERISFVEYRTSDAYKPLGCRCPGSQPKALP